jgi:hypothetical protein
MDIAFLLSFRLKNCLLALTNPDLPRLESQFLISKIHSFCLSGGLQARRSETIGLCRRLLLQGPISEAQENCTCLVAVGDFFGSAGFTRWPHGTTLQPCLGPDKIP